MKNNRWLTGMAFFFGLLAFAGVPAQTGAPIVVKTPAPGLPRPTPAPPLLSTTLSRNLEQSQAGTVSRERREAAYAKLLEGQRHIWGMNRLRSQAGMLTGARLASQALQSAVELDPNLAEAYTALAELTWRTPPHDVEETVSLARLAVKIDPDNFGARRILARIQTVKSGLGRENFDAAAGQKAVAEWKEVARLDPRNAEAWAFLSEFYDWTNKNEERIEALKKWIGAATPIETGFYKLVFPGQGELTPESASLKLGEALIKAGREREAVEILSQAVADDPENAEAIDLLRQALENGDAGVSETSVLALQQAAFANPSNAVLVALLAQAQSRIGKTDEAVKSLRASITNLAEKDKSGAANLQVSLGDLLAEANRVDESVSAYEAALKLQGIERELVNTEEEREFAMRVFEKMIRAFKNAGRIDEARATIERARLVLGKSDLFADKQLVSLLGENGKKAEALRTVRGLRVKMPNEYSLLRLEASLLTELGKPDEAVALIKPLIGAGKTLSAPSLMYDDFSNYIFISSLYSQARRGREAVLAARQAFQAAEGEERKQIANLSLATAQQQAGDFEAAEETLRALLRQNPGNPIALNNLGYFLIERNEKIGEAQNLIERAVKIDPTNSSYLDSLGWANFKLGKLAEAERFLKQALRLNPSSATINEHLGDVYQKQNKPELAAAAWRKALLLSSDSLEAARLKSKLSPNVSRQ